MEEHFAPSEMRYILNFKVESNVDMFKVFLNPEQYGPKTEAGGAPV